MTVPRSSRSESMSEDCSTKARNRFSVSRSACSVSRRPTDFGGFPRAGRRDSGALFTRAGLGLTPMLRGLLRDHGMGLRSGAEIMYRKLGSTRKEIRHYFRLPGG